MRGCKTRAGTHDEKRVTSNRRCMLLYFPVELQRESVSLSKTERKKGRKVERQKGRKFRENGKIKGKGYDGG